MSTLTNELVDFLLGATAQAALAQLAAADLRDGALLARLTELRRTFAPGEAAALLDQARLRQRAAAKLPHAERLLLLDEALQQASSAAVAAYRAQRFAHYERVADLGCGIGADTLALAAAGPQVLAVERDPLRARLAELNVRACGLAGRVRVQCADWRALPLAVDAAFADPARRADGRRVFSLHAMQPPLADIQALRARVPDVAVKVAPGVDYAEVPPDAEVECISLAGDMKEALLLFGGLRQGAARRATLLPGAHQLDSAMPDAASGVSAPQRFLYEPDAAVIRAGLVRQLATRIGAAQIDAEIAYLTSAQPLDTPFARAWQIVQHGPFNLKHLNEWLRSLGAGDVIVKKRGSPIDPDAFRRRLKTVAGGATLTVFLTHAQGKPWMIVGQPVGQNDTLTRL